MQPPRILPPHYFFVSLGLMVGIDLLVPQQWVAGWAAYAGVVPTAAGLFLALAGANLFKRAGTNIIPLSQSSALVEQGVFRVSRNPMYLGMLLFLSGLSWLLSNLYSALVLPVFFAVIRQQFVLKEETLMEQTFGSDYLAYKHRVRRWL